MATFYEPVNQEAERKLASSFTCSFELWDGEKMGTCGEPAYGYMTSAKRCLCKGHLVYAKAVLQGGTRQYTTQDVEKALVKLGVKV